tara:strand:+ start:1576 stop:2022 length:447 start_codon:yes stop_codon:yes gene_type:complete
MGNMSGRIMNTMDYLTDDPRNNCVNNIPVSTVVVYSVSTSPMSSEILEQKRSEILEQKRSEIPEQNLGSHNNQTQENYTISRPFDTTEARTNLDNNTLSEETEQESKEDDKEETEVLPKKDSIIDIDFEESNKTDETMYKPFIMSPDN